MSKLQTIEKSCNYAQIWTQYRRVKFYVKNLHGWENIAKKIIGGCIFCHTPQLVTRQQPRPAYAACSTLEKTFSSLRDLHSTDLGGRSLSGLGITCLTAYSVRLYMWHHRTQSRRSRPRRDSDLWGHTYTVYSGVPRCALSINTNSHRHARHDKTGETDKSVRFSRQIFQGFDIPKIIIIWQFLTELFRK